VKEERLNERCEADEADAGGGGAEAVGERAVTRSVAARGAELQNKRLAAAGGWRCAEHRPGRRPLPPATGRRGWDARDEPDL
jgi:hypothetical protein